jgi:hypothetical protein
MFVGHWSAGQLWLPSWVCGVVPTLAFLSFMPLVVIAGVAVPYSLACWWRGRRADAVGTSWIGGGATLGLLLLFSTSRSMMDLRVSGFASLGKAAMPIVEAVHRFESERGTAPTTLEQLVPTYLSSLPPWSDRLSYSSAPKPAKEMYDNSWVIRVNAGFGLGFDSFVYFPRQNYPEHLYGGVPERVGAWAYVHE